MTAPLLEVKGLTVQFGVHKAVNNLDLTVHEGQLVGLIGTNGAGKTTALDALTGFVKASGTAHYQGRELLTRAPHRRARAGLVRTWQSLELFDDLTVRENVLVGASARSGTGMRHFLGLGGSRKTDPDEINRILELLGLAERADDFPTDFSQGQRKMVVLARGLAMKPTILMADEPAAGLDTEESLWLGGQLRKLVDGGLTILLVDHDMGLVLGICDYIYVLNQGLLIAEGTPSQIKTNPTVMDAYLGHSADNGLQAAEVQA